MDATMPLNYFNQAAEWLQSVKNDAGLRFSQLTEESNSLYYHVSDETISFYERQIVPVLETGKVFYDEQMPRISEAAISAWKHLPLAADIVTTSIGIGNAVYFTKEALNVKSKEDRYAASTLAITYFLIGFVGAFRAAHRLGLA